MKLLYCPDLNSVKAIAAQLQRPANDVSTLRSTVEPILADIKINGDAALKKYTLQFDGVELESLIFEIPTEINLDATLKTAIDRAYRNIFEFHNAQVREELPVETMKGIVCYRKSVAIERVGLYIPGGTAPLFSTVLMLAIPARIAGCSEIVLCTPPNKEGKIHPAIQYAAQKCGIKKIITLGGTQAIGAMAFGTESVTAVYKIFGPGNPYVTVAKQIIQMQGVAIDMPAGPSEVLIIADGTAHPKFIAADLLAQAEHGVDSQVVLVCTNAETVNAVFEALNEQIVSLPRGHIAAKALENSVTIIANDLNTAVALSNAYAPEHLIIQTDNATTVAEKIINAGSVFIGHFSPESVGDYASGTNHTLPTQGFARAYSGVSVESFTKKITFQHLTEQGLQNIAQTVIIMAEAESLYAHAEAVRKRFEG